MKAKPPAQDITSEIRQWIEENPLRQHRISFGLTLSVAACLLDVSTGTIQQWEAGTRQPRIPHLERIGRMIAAHDPATGNKIGTHWNRWQSRKPTQKGKQT
jgi:DNA-binding transcriptional regulator YiaG